jgi:hypothetical protein
MRNKEETAQKFEEKNSLARKCCSWRLSSRSCFSGCSLAGKIALHNCDMQK